jgi:hypothetical protein
MSFINHAEQNLHYDQQIEAIENEIRTLQVTMPIGDIESMPEALAASLDELFINLHIVIALKCVSTIAPENTLIVDAIQHQQALKVLDVGKLAKLMSDQIELLQEALVQFDRDTQSTAMMKQTIAEFFIARQALVDTAISDSYEADNFCQCSSFLQSTYHQFTAGFDYVCTQCETPFFK